MSSPSALDPQLSPAELEDQIRRFILTDLAATPLRRLAPDTPLFETLLDSTSVLALVSHLEERYHIQIRDSEVVPRHFGTLRGLVELVGAKWQTSGALGG